MSDRDDEVFSAVDAAARELFEMHAPGLTWRELPTHLREHWVALWVGAVQAHHSFNQRWGFAEEEGTS